MRKRRNVHAQIKNNAFKDQKLHYKLQKNKKKNKNKIFVFMLGFSQRPPQNNRNNLRKRAHSQISKRRVTSKPKKPQQPSPQPTQPTQPSTSSSSDMTEISLLEKLNSWRTKTEPQVVPSVVPSVVVPSVVPVVVPSVVVPHSVLPDNNFYINGFSVCDINMIPNLQTQDGILIEKNTSIKLYYPIQNGPNNGKYVLGMTNLFDVGYVPLFIHDDNNQKKLCVSTFLR